MKKIKENIMINKNNNFSMKIHIWYCFCCSRCFSFALALNSTNAHAVEYYSAAVESTTPTTRLTHLMLVLLV